MLSVSALENVSGTMAYLFGQMNLTVGLSGTAYQSPTYFIPIQYHSGIYHYNGVDTDSTVIEINNYPALSFVRTPYPFYYLPIRCVAR